MSQGSENHAGGSRYPKETVIVPRKGLQFLQFREFWEYRELLGVLIRRDIKVRYRQTVLGGLWAILQPLTAMAIFTVIFGNLAGMPSDGHPYALFVYSALLPWTFFANAVGASGTSLVGSAALISKVYFPRVIIPVASVGSGMVDFAVAAAILFVLMPIYGVALSVHLLLVPVLVAVLVLVTLGVGMLLSALTVAYRDFRYVVPFMLQVWMFVTPVVFPASLVPEKARWILLLNPMTGVIEGFRSVVLGKVPDYAALGVSFLLAAAVFLAGIVYFGKVERRFADII